ncbi:metalloregulator ArsR/SmtB family transcription factor [Lichenifustis flavocetrariae]|uniref:Metalloregulator ArsR/SmtB family transcription factor n=1 Tax=Lichenifustis flavocetrariae TaxID=2949735 RepID=A0AA41YXR1_9HYPH|nr:metalloregulator ArsR/SmtB family transcription factor [Lichenifustis flavocetrariae]MCW6510506.1 metalloregulator ArsR/SmtB family transcription factor [Lichenifustis flavocetrariae]
MVSSFPTVLAALEAAGEETRLRLLALLLEAELTVSELVAILGQSQPRVSRHLKLLTEAGLVERHREGAWAFFAVAHRTPLADLAREVIRRLDPADSVLTADRARLAEVRAGRLAQAERYFATKAADWDRLRVLHVAEERVEQAVLDAVGPGPFHAMLDLGTGTGRMLELLAGRARRAVGIDGSPAMLSVARARLDRKALPQVQLRQGDLYALPVERDGYDLVVIHQVLHYLDEPGRAIREAARVLRPGGRLVVVDFAPHHEESLRDQHAHRRLGFARSEIDDLMTDAGLDIEASDDVSPLGHEAGKLTVSLWIGRDRRLLTDAPLTIPQRAVA